MAIWSKKITFEITLQSNMDDPTKGGGWSATNSGDDLWDMISQTLANEAPGWFTHTEGAEWWIANARTVNEQAGWTLETRRRTVLMPTVVEGAHPSEFEQAVYDILTGKRPAVFPFGSDPLAPRVVKVIFPDDIIGEV